MTEALLLFLKLAEKMFERSESRFESYESILKFSRVGYLRKQNEKEKDMGVWQTILIGLYCFSLGINAVNHGKPRTGNYSFWSSLIETAIVMFLLYKGGFFG